MFNWFFKKNNKSALKSLLIREISEDEFEPQILTIIENKVIRTESLGVFPKAIAVDAFKIEAAKLYKL